jgi:transcriptional regulator with XRE-family HTH domain
MEDAAVVIRNARVQAGLSQRELARKAHTAQSVVARIELGETSPSWDTLMRLLRASGHTLRAVLERTPTVDPSILDDVPRILRLTPEERLEEVARVSRFIAEARRV